MPRLMSNKITVTGILAANGPKVLLNRVPLEPGPSLLMRNHSPTGFAWGYLGSGPAQLALAILLELYGEAIASAYYQRFKEDHVAQWPFNKDFNVTVDIDRWLEGVKTSELDRR